MRPLFLSLFYGRFDLDHHFVITFARVYLQGVFAPASASNKRLLNFTTVIFECA
jgi:hypothetical protein